MTDLVWPAWLRQSAVKWRVIYNTERSPSPVTGLTQTASRPGGRVACTVSVETSTGDERRHFRALAAKLRGGGNRIFFPDIAFTRAGAWVGGELFANSDFRTSTTGWTVVNGAIAVTDSVLRLRSTSSTPPELTQAPLLTQYAPHVIRSIVTRGRGDSSKQGVVELSLAASVGVRTISASRGYNAVAGVVLDGTGLSQYPFYITGGQVNVANDFDEVHFASLSRCLLVDGGANLLLRSNEFDNASWTKSGSTVTANALAGPDGTTTADHIVDSSSTQHYVTQAVTVGSAAAEYELTVSVRAGARTWAAIAVTESTSSHEMIAYVNLSTGALGTVSVSGANWTNQRAVVIDQGGGWKKVTLIGRKASAATTITAFIFAAEGNGDTTFAATSGNAISVWRAHLSPSSAPSRGALTTSAAIAAQSHAAGADAFYVKGGPASMQGLLREGDVFEVSGQIKIVTAALDLDAGGNGYLKFEPPMSRAVLDSTPIILTQPICKMMLVEDEVEFDCRPGGYSNFEFDFVQDLAT